MPLPVAGHDRGCWLVAGTSRVRGRL